MATAQHHRLYYLIHTFIWLYKGVVTYYWRGGEEIWCRDAVKKNFNTPKSMWKKTLTALPRLQKKLQHPPPLRMCVRIMNFNCFTSKK